MVFKKPVERTDEQKAAFAYYMANPCEAVKDWFGATPDDWQGDLLDGLFKSGLVDRASLKACHGPGKSAVLSWAGWIFMNGCEGSRTVATAPTFSQLNDVLWPEFSKWYSRFPQVIKDEWQISGRHIRHKGDPYNWFAVARTSNKAANVQGFHNDNVLFIGDEASAIPQPVFEVMEGALSEAGDGGKKAMLLLAGNPNFLGGELYDSFNKNRDLYHRITVTGDKNVLAELGVEQGQVHRDHGKVYYSPRVKEKYRSTMERKYGLESAIYDVRVKGFFPRTSERALIPLSWAEHAATLDTPLFDPVADEVTLVVDPARGGINEATFGAFRQGMLFEAIRSERKKSLVLLANSIITYKMELIARGLRVSNIIVDEPGVGGGLIDILQSLGHVVTPYNGGIPMKKDVDHAEEVRLFKNRRARDWWGLRRKFESGTYPIPYDQELINQLASMLYEYTDPGEQIKVESKEDMKDRLGKDASPDRADLLVMGGAPSYSMAKQAPVVGIDDIMFGDDRPVLDDFFGNFQ